MEKETMNNPFLELKHRNAWGPGSFEMALPLIEAVGVKAGMRVLEVGGGSGQIATVLAKHWNVTVFALEPWFGGERIQAVAAAADVFDRVIALKMTAQEMAFADATFDAVISIGSFEMIGEKRAVALAQMVRVAKSGARIGIAEPMCLPVPIPPEIAELDRAQASVRAGMFSDDALFQDHFRTVEWNAELFRQAGLTITEHRYFSEAFKWWWEQFSIERPPTSEFNRKYNLERDLVKADGGRWLSLGMVVGEKP
jgi:cyclopropane fatty-acyl-phospholipid synthase-like methyltransferase